MRVLASDPLGEKRAETKAEVVQNIVNLPNRQALVKIGTETHHIQTFDRPANTYHLSAPLLKKRQGLICYQTRGRYCTPKDKVEREMMQWLGAWRQEPAPATERPFKPEQEVAPQKPWSPFEDE